MGQRDGSFVSVQGIAGETVMVNIVKVPSRRDAVYSAPAAQLALLLVSLTALCQINLHFVRFPGIIRSVMPAKPRFRSAGGCKATPRLRQEMP